MKSKFTLLLFVFWLFQGVFSQNVGIGTPTPQSKLSINGNLAIGSNYDSLIAPINGLIIEGNTGVGTSNPTAQFHTNGTARFENLLSQNGTGMKLTQIDANGNFSALNSGTTGQILSQGASGLTWASPQNWLLTGNVASTTDFIGTTNAQDFKIRTNNTQKMVIKSGGNVGIGILNPTEQLTVLDPGILVEDHNGNPRGGFRYLGSQVTAIQGLSNPSGNTTATLVFQTEPVDNVSNPTTQMAILENGNVGIGTITPNTQLHTTGGVRFQSLSGTGNRIVQTDANGNLSALTQGTTGQLLSQGASGLTWTSPQNWLLTGNAASATNFIGTTNAQDFRIRTNNVQRMVVKSGGNIGMGTSTPLEKLEVNGAVKIGTTTTTNVGTIRYESGIFEGWNGYAWIPFNPILYDKFMTSDWIFNDPDNVVTFDFPTIVSNNSINGYLFFDTTGTGSEKLFQVQLIPPNILADTNAYIIEIVMSMSQIPASPVPPSGSSLDNDIYFGINDGIDFTGFALLDNTNAQTRLIEDANSTMSTPLFNVIETEGAISDSLRRRLVKATIIIDGTDNTPYTWGALSNIETNKFGALANRYNRFLNPSSGLNFAVYKDHPYEQNIIDFVHVQIRKEIKLSN